VTPLLEARDLSFGYEDVDLVRDVTLDVGAGEMVAVAGPNGAGKSTLVRLLAGDLAPTSGRVVLNGIPLTQTPVGDLAIQRSYLGQQLPIEIPFTVRQVVAMGRYPHRDQPGNSSDADSKAIDDAIEITDIEHLADRAFTTLSGGEAQRAHVARVLAQQTPVTVLDEPTAALDIAHQQLVLRSLRRVAATGGAVIAVLHDLNLGAAFADRLVLLSGGMVAASGPPGEVLVEETLSRVYDHPIRVIEHPFRKAPLVLPADEER